LDWSIVGFQAIMKRQLSNNPAIQQSEIFTLTRKRLQMLQYVIIARDGNDANALERRMNARPNHFKGARILKDNNNLVLGGAILDDNGKMAGSVMIVQFETEEAMRKWFNNEPYVTERVWQSIELKPFKVAEV